MRKIGDVIKWTHPVSGNEHQYYIFSFWKESEDTRYLVKKTKRDSRFVVGYGACSAMSGRPNLEKNPGYRFIKKEEVI